MFLHGMLTWMVSKTKNTMTYTYPIGSKHCDILVVDTWMVLRKEDTRPTLVIRLWLLISGVKKESIITNQQETNIKCKSRFLLYSRGVKYHKTYKGIWSKHVHDTCQYVDWIRPYFQHTSTKLRIVAYIGWKKA